MTFAAPLFLALGAAAVAAVAAIHLVARATPAERDLPTARFVPPSALRVPAFQRRPSDLPLLALRALALLLLGLGLAGPAPTGARRPVARVVLLDNSRAVADPAGARARARAAVGPGDVLVAFDSTARVVAADGPVPMAAAVRGTLSAALVVAVREAERVGRDADSLELVVVSPVVEEEWDAAVTRLRSLWPGGVRIERVAAAAATTPPVITIDAPADDPLRASIALLGARGGAASARLVRGIPAAADSSVAMRGGVLVDWPADPAARFGARARPDTFGAVMAEGHVVVASFARPGPLTAEPGARPVAWWVDGEIAATERPLGTGCARQVAVPVPAVGDLAIRPAMLRFVGALTAPCGGTPRLTPVPDAVLATLAAGPSAPPADRPVRAGSRPLTVALFGLALLALLGEGFLRRRTA